MRRVKGVGGALATAAGVFAFAAPASAAPVYGLTAGGGLVSFDSASPDTVSAPKPITGGVDGGRLVSIDVRPATGELYGLVRSTSITSAAKLVKIDPTTGVATGLTPGFGAFLGLNGTEVDIDFNPTVDRIRVVTDGGRNARLDPNNGTTVTSDGGLNYAGTAATGISAAAYTNSRPLATETQLFDIDTTNDQLALQDPPNAGTLTKVGNGLGFDAKAVSGFDITPTNVALALLTPATASSPSLYTVDTTTGAASGAAAVAGTGPNEVVDIAAAPVLRTLVAIESEQASNQGFYLFRQDRPDQLGPRTEITGLDSAERVVGVDRRPATGEVTLVTKQLFTGQASLRALNLSTGVAGAPRTTDIAITGGFSGFGQVGVGVDYNPVVNLLRVTTQAANANGNNNFRLNPDTGKSAVTAGDPPAAAEADGPLAYAVGDPNAGTTPQVVDSGYTNSVSPAPATTALYDIDAGLDVLAQQNPANAGTLTTRGPLGVNVTNIGSLDYLPTLGGGSLGLGALQTTDNGPSSLYAVGNNNNAPGEARVIGTFARADGVALTRAIGGITALEVDTVGFDAPQVRAEESTNVATITVRRTDGGGDAAGTVEFSTADGTAQAGRDYTATTGTLTFAPGDTTKTITVPIGNDLVTGDRAFTVRLTNATGGLVLGSPLTTTVTIADDDAAQAPRETLYGLTAGGALTTFASDKPGRTSTPLPIAVPAGEALVGIDVRPATGQLYGVTKGAGTTANGRVYVIDTLTGAVRLVTTTPFDLGAGTSFDIDFNPVPDRIRIVNEANLNLRVNPNTGNLAVKDTDLAFAAGDANAGQDPYVNAAAYTNPTPQNPAPGVTTKGTQLFVLESTRNVLALQDPPNNGTLNTRRPLGIALGLVSGFDISSKRNTGYAVNRPSGPSGQGPATLYVIDVDGDETVAAGRVGDLGSTADPVVDIAVAQDTFQFAAVTSAVPQQVFQFRQDRPGTKLSDENVVGLAAGERIVGIDTQVRPASELTALTDQGRLYTLDPSTGAATNPRTVSPALSGTSFGVDFNPTVDRLRVVSDTTQNLRVDPTTGAATVDGALKYANGDPAPKVVAAGYTNSQAGATSTQLFVVDQANGGRLAVQSPPNDGTLTAVGTGPLLTGGIETVAALDIAPGLDTQFAALQPTGAAASGFYAVNGASFNPAPSAPATDQRGQAVRIGAFEGGAVAGLAFLPQDRVGLASAKLSTSEEGGKVTLSVVRSQTGDQGVRSSVTVATADGTAKAGTDYTALAPTVVTFEPGETVKTVEVPIAASSPTVGDRAFTVVLSAPKDVSLGSPRTTTVTIEDGATTVPGPDVPGPPVPGPPVPGPSVPGPAVPGPTVFVPVPAVTQPTPDTLKPSALFAVRDLTLRTFRSRGAGVRFSCSEACTVTTSVRLGSVTVGRGTGRLTAAGRGTFQVRLTTAGKRRVGSTRARRLVIASTVRDAAGNTSTDRTAFRATVPARR